MKNFLTLLVVLISTTIPLPASAVCTFEYTKFNDPAYPHIQRLSVINCTAGIYQNPCTLFANKTEHQILLMGKGYTAGAGFFASGPVDLWSEVGLLDYDESNPIIISPHGSLQFKLIGIYKCSVRFYRTGQILQEQCDHVLRFKTEVTKNDNGNC